MSSEMTTEERIEELEVYTQIGNDECTDAVQVLCDIFGHSDFLSVIFIKQVEKEIARKHKYYKEHVTITEKSTTAEFVSKRLEWN